LETVTEITFMMELTTE